MTIQTNNTQQKNGKSTYAILFSLAIVLTGIVIWTQRPIEPGLDDLQPTASGKSVIDVMVLYNDNADKLYSGGAITRINHLIDVSNQVYDDSKVNMSLRLVHTEKLDYEANYSSETAIEQLTKQSHPAFIGVQDLRLKYGADLVILMRPYSDDGYCGIAWIGGNKTGGDFSRSGEKDYGYSHVSIDCGTYVLAHEIGHNMGLNHSRKQDTNGATFDFALGHGVDNDFVTMMAYSSAFNASKTRLFSSPGLSCGSESCGINRDADTGADAVYTLNIVAPQIAEYFSTKVEGENSWVQARYDSDGNGIADVVLQHSSGSWNFNSMKGATVNLVKDLSINKGQDWKTAGREDYDGDGLADLLVRNESSGEWYMYLLKDGQVKAEKKLSLTSNTKWQVQGTGDFDGDGKGDILLRHEDGRWYQYFLNGMAIKSTGRPGLPTDLAYSIASSGDFNGDGRTDVLLRMDDGSWHLNIMKGSEITSTGSLAMKKSRDWKIMGSGDFDGDEIDDLLLRYKNGSWLVYHMNEFKVRNSGFLEITNDLDWVIASTGDFDGDGNNDILLRNEVQGSWMLYAMNQTKVIAANAVGLTTDLDWLVPAS